MKTRSSGLVKGPWNDGSTPSLRLDDWAQSTIIMGASFGGLLFAVRLLDAGFIVIVDTAARFGGTCYWNRYPGLRCDTESYFYMPPVQETRHMIKHKWSDDAAEWMVEMTQLSSGGESVMAKARANFVIIVPRLLNRPKISDLPGLYTFQGQSFLASRWNYTVTGGSQVNPSLSKLKDKRVGIIGFELDGFANPNQRAGVSVTGTGGQNIDERWSRSPTTLHGVISNGFPNMFFSSCNQAGISPNLTASLDTFAQNEAEEAWAMHIRAGALARSPVANCTPSYHNGEGGNDNMSMEE
ncbi:hypothetical protein ETB97_001021 [Aspergillus alliaceus]|uniref:FAD/NAD(P)-binding domain-containing protein n=1 Tax=Petromyces alliaceus TaxID=209559 RepID=A0A8H6A2T9_PETAA|nr:hypothetical protein ETB97_001021 [Aspergillus burnettii]